jgi:hypothetical protein
VPYNREETIPIAVIPTSLKVQLHCVNPWKWVTYIDWTHRKSLKPEQHFLGQRLVLEARIILNEYVHWLNIYPTSWLSLAKQECNLWLPSMRSQEPSPSTSLSAFYLQSENRILAY